MSTHKNLMTVCCAAVLAFGLAACGGGGGGGDAPVASTNGGAPVVDMNGNGPEPGDESEPTALETVQADAATAAMDAQTAAGAAQTAADAAQTARADRAVIQTGDLHGGNSGMLAHSAYMQSKAAADAAKDAQDASDAAAEATDVIAATRALVIAETARDDAVEAQGMAETHSEAAVAASEVEVKVVEKTKTVGPVDDQTSITVDGVEKKNTIGDVERRTGLIPDENLALETDGVRDEHGRLVAPVDKNGYAVIVDVPRTAETPSIGFTYDSADDTARLTLITAYLGSQKQVQFVRVVQTPANPFVAILAADAVGAADPVGEEVGAPVLPNPTAPEPETADGLGGTERVLNGAYTVVEGKIIIDHDGFPSPEVGADEVFVDDPDTPGVDERMTFPVTVAPKLAGDNFVDSADTDDDGKYLLRRNRQNR